YDMISGDHVWSRVGGGAGSDAALALSLDGDGVVVAGGFAGTASIGGAELTSAGESDVFVARYATASGEHVWSARHGGPGFDLATGLVASHGTVTLAGSFSGRIELGDGELTSAGSNDVFIASYDAA